jgi:hypothetical protein
MRVLGTVALAGCIAACTTAQATSGDEDGWMWPWERATPVTPTQSAQQTVHGISGAWTPRPLPLDFFRVPLNLSTYEPRFCREMGTVETSPNRVPGYVGSTLHVRVNVSRSRECLTSTPTRLVEMDLLKGQKAYYCSRHQSPVSLCETRTTLVIERELVVIVQPGADNTRNRQRQPHESRDPTYTGGPREPGR